MALGLILLWVVVLFPPALLPFGAAFAAWAFTRPKYRRRR